MTSRRQSLLYSTIPRTRSGTTRAAQRDTGAGLPAGAGGGEWTGGFVAASSRRNGEVG